jgi:conjugation system TraG family ATPase
MPVMGVKDGCIISRRGEVTLAWEISGPVLTSVDEPGYDDMHSSLAMAARMLPPWTMIHIQDVFRNEEYQPHPAEGFLARAYEEHFKGRKYLVHRQFIFLTMTSRASALKPASSSAVYGIRMSMKLPSQSEISLFVGKAAEFITAITSSGRLHARRLTQEELEGTADSPGLIHEYLMLGDRGPLLSDMQLSPSSVRVYDKEVWGFSISEGEEMPSNISTVSRMEGYCTPASEVFSSYGASLGVLLDCEHIFNLMILIPAQTFVLSELEGKRKRMRSMSNDNANRMDADEIFRYAEKVHKDSLMTVYMHADVHVWGKPEEYDDIRTKVSSALSLMGITATQNLDDLPVTWFSGIPGAACELGVKNLMKQELNASLCLRAPETYQSGLDGGLFTLSDRFRHIPLRLDFQKAARDAGLIDNYNAFVLGPSGSGKSFFMNHFLHCCYEAGEEIFVIDVGDSYEGTAELIRNESGGRDGLYYSWDMDHPVSFNPFIGFREWLDEGDRLRQDHSGVSFFLSFLQTVWEPRGGWRSEMVTVLMKIVRDFVMNRLALKKDDSFPIFNDFYDFITDEVQNDIMSGSYECGSVVVDSRRFDIEGFMLALAPYKGDGVYSFLLNDPDPKDLFSNRFTVFEVERLSNMDKIFYSVCILCIMNAFDLKMRHSRNFKIMVIEEAWKAIDNESMAPYLKNLWKVARKYSTSAVVVTQQISDIVSSEIIKDSILKNSDVKILLDQSSEINSFGELSELLGFGGMEKSLVLSMNRNKDSRYHYREVFVKTLAGAEVYATEVSPEQVIAFNSDKVEKKILHDRAQKCGSLSRAIQEIAESKRKK